MVCFGLVSLICDEIDCCAAAITGRSTRGTFSIEGGRLHVFPLSYLISFPTALPLAPPWGYARRQAGMQAAIQPHIILSPSPPLVGKVMGARLFVSRHHPWFFTHQAHPLSSWGYFTTHDFGFQGQRSVVYRWFLAWRMIYYILNSETPPFLIGPPMRVYNT